MMVSFPALTLLICSANFLSPKIPINIGSGESITSIKLCGKLGIIVKGHIKGFMI